MADFDRGNTRLQLHVLITSVIAILYGMYIQRVIFSIASLRSLLLDRLRRLELESLSHSNEKDLVL